MPTSFSHIVLRLFTFPLLLLQLLQNCYLYFCHCYHYYHTTLLLNTLLQILSFPGVVELTTQLLILENILWLPLCRINKFGLNTLPSKTVAIPYTRGSSACIYKKVSGSSVAFLILYVDDILLIGNYIEFLESIKGYLNKIFFNERPRWSCLYIGHQDL